MKMNFLPSASYSIHWGFLQSFQVRFDTVLIILDSYRNFNVRPMWNSYFYALSTDCLVRFSKNFSQSIVDKLTMNHFRCSSLFVNLTFFIKWTMTTMHFESVVRQKGFDKKKWSCSNDIVRVTTNIIQSEWIEISIQLLLDVIGGHSPLSIGTLVNKESQFYWTRLNKFST